MDDVFISCDLDKIEVEELIVVVGSYLFSGNKLDTVETDVIEKLSEVPKYEIIH